MLAQNDVAYLVPSDDPWMPAHQPGTGDGMTIYVGDHDVNLLGCVDQYQVCNPNSPASSSCSALTGALKLINSLGQSATSLGLNDQQQATVNRFMETSIFRGMYYSVNGRGASALNGWCNLTNMFALC
jgi:hypothetical protein